MGLRGLPYLPLAIGAALLALLAVLATLQYRWIGQGSALESQRLHAALFVAGSQLEEDFDREITRTFRAFFPAAAEDGADPAARLARQEERWAAEAAYPRLLREVFYVHFAGNPEAGAAPTLAVLRRDPPRLEATAWPAELAPLRARLAATAPAAADALAPLPPLPPLSAVLGDGPGLLLPARRRRDRARGAGASGDRVLLWLDRATMAREILPELTRRHFGSAQGLQNAVAVLDVARPAHAVFLSDPSWPASAFASGDLSLPIFGLRSSGDRQGRGRRSLPPPAGGERPDDLAGLGLPAEAGPAAHGAWSLVVKRRNGSLAAAVLGYRRRNLAISAGILALLALTIGLMVATTERARRLARQQMEFVAAVSHELNTPIAAILAAGQNLAHGVVAEPAQVERYGALIEREGRRLSGMVGQVMDFAGIQAGRQAYALQPTEVRAVVDGALADCRGLLAERQAEVEMDLAAGLPPVQGDPAALRRALRNLIENAAKYGGPHPWIGVRARPEGREIEITVADRGPGVDREDAPHLFEPFFRGRDAVARSLAGSGLGLAVVRHVVEAHHGRVSVATDGRGRGSAFTLHLPAAMATAWPASA